MQNDELDMDSGNTAEQVSSQDDEQATRSVAEKLKTAYINAREQLEIIEVELNQK